MKLERDYIIPFVGLKLGKHSFTFSIADSFFESFDYSIIQKGDLTVELSLDKKETMMIGDFIIRGDVELDCDRCTDTMKTSIESEYQIIYKFGTEPSDDENLIVIYPEEFEIDVRNTILELVTVSLSSRNVHEEGECNEEMMKLMEDYVLVEEGQSDQEEEDFEDEIDPRWSALKKLNK